MKYLKKHNIKESKKDRKPEFDKDVVSNWSETLGIQE